MSKELPKDKALGQLAGEVARKIALEVPHGKGWLSPEEIHQSGLLYHINETVLWPLGLALAVSFDPETKRYESFLAMRDFGEVIQDPMPEIRARANAWLAERFKTVKP